MLDQITAWQWIPTVIRVDTGPDFLPGCFASWSADRGIVLRYIQLGQPNQNAFVERFNRTFCQEVLGAYVFESRDQLRMNGTEWVREYNEERPHDTLGGMVLARFRVRMTTESSSLIMSP